MLRKALAIRFASLAFVFASSVSGLAQAGVTEPNGLAVPINSGSEIQLNAFFASRGENIDWINDAHTTPNTFSPLCGFTATYVLNQAGSHFGLAWYNDTGMTPAASDLHQLVPPNSAVGTTFSGTVIRNDPAYTGGLVGFALVGGETHYTDPNYDTLCSGCSPPGPWITALIYASTVTPNAYYICFEDGGTSAFTWDNDGDFNDDVYFVTGISCAGGGQTCDTGMPGICAAGLTQCSATSSTGTTCQQLNQPAATETCNGLDDNCNGQTDEGAICPASYVCDKGTCVQSCQGGEFMCAPGLVCSADGHCVDPLCVNVSCPMGQICVAGACKGPCDGVTCPNPEVCRVGACVDPCMGVTCQAGEVCSGGVCIESCTCAPCPMGTACNATSGQCGDPMCTTSMCAAGTYCVAGQCVDDCMGAVCPAGQTCSAGACVAEPDAGAMVDSGGGLVGPGDDAGTVTPGDGGKGGKDAGAEGGALGFGPKSAKGGCGCVTAGSTTGGGALVWLFVAGLAALGARRRSRV